MFTQTIVFPNLLVANKGIFFVECKELSNLSRKRKRNINIGWEELVVFGHFYEKM